MPPLRLTDGTSSLVIDLASWDGDAYVAVAVESRGFAGRNDLHVVADAFQTFCTSLVSLQRTLKGEARLTGVMPNELDIVLAPADALGHIVVKGHIGYDVQMAHTSYWHAVHFGFQVEPTQLDAAANVPWVTEHAV
jgi:hypothetical protein